MYIIKIKANNDGSRPALQTWNGAKPPKNYAVCPDEFFNTFYSTTPSGFVNITIEGDTVTAMTVNKEALEAYIASVPEPVESDPTTEDILNTLLGVTK